MQTTNEGVRELGDGLSDARDSAPASSIWARLTTGELRVVASRSDAARRTYLLETRDASSDRVLTRRERIVAERLGRGQSCKEIGHLLELSSSSVSRCIDAAAQKLGLAGRLDLAVLSAAVGPASWERASTCTRVLMVHRAGLVQMLLVAELGQSALWSLLSPSERDVATLAIAGNTGRTIAALRGARSARTVANQLAQVFRKTGVSGRVELAARLLAS